MLQRCRCQDPLRDRRRDRQADCCLRAALAAAAQALDDRESQREHFQRRRARDYIFRLRAIVTSHLPGVREHRIGRCSRSAEEAPLPEYGKNERADLYRTVTEKIIAQIEAGAGEYRMPWHHDGSSVGRPKNVLSDAPYRGINVVMLVVAAHASGYSTGRWATYRQWKEIGAQVRSNERGTLIVFWKRLADDGPQPQPESDGMEPDNEDSHRQRIVARGYTVFNAAQVDGYVAFEPPPLPQVARIDRAEQFYRHLEIDTRFGGDAAYYVPSKDYIQVPPLERFRDAESFYATLLHEGAHATSARHRLNRNLSTRFGSEAYAMEEMIADWLAVLGRDPRAVFTAAARAQGIVDWMWSRQPLTEHPMS